MLRLSNAEAKTESVATEAKPKIFYAAHRFEKQLTKATLKSRLFFFKKEAWKWR